MSKRIVQVLSCKCGIQYAVAIVPHCHQDVEWLKEMRDCSLEGGSVDMIDMDESPLHLYEGKCECGMIKVTP